MLITKKRIKNCSKYIAHIEEGKTALIGLPVTDDISARLKEIGFNTMNAGESLVPSPKLGTVSKFNAIGKDLPQKHLPMETVYRQQNWEWEDWNGTTYSRTVDIPYKRYPRIWTPAPWVSLTIIQSGEKKFITAGDSFTKSLTPEEDITHRINLMLQLFKRVEILQENLERYEVPRIERLGWDVLPTGSMPWEQFKPKLTPLLEKSSKGKKKIIADRLESVSKHQPDFHAIGTNGYRGYVIFGFTKLNLYIFETAEYGNATYVFEGDWKTLSGMTKAEIIAGNLHKHRFVHQEGWTKQIDTLFPNNPNQRIS
ncbi:hypothetical protein E2R51_17095 [Jeotgalibacillus sp. S-D1]|uniref:hypothetical protein n=1 Tax=Jeotgalibacillus sp. S-D1 TaxID=2552189 RepID=UPI00105A84DD|nr:hypothetical protein [Jeotgalibacillus sp. S-D1]TDL30701.1 hypothetical protein E2R51_17095 [Jeotgalibacillus sp. S-D1]